MSWAPYYSSWQDSPSTATPITAASLANFDAGIKQALAQAPVIAVAPSGDTTGATDVANVNSANTSLVNGGIGGTILLQPGVYYGNSQVTLAAQTVSGTTGGKPVNLLGCYGSTVWKVVGNITGFNYHRTSGYGAQYGLAAQLPAGYIRDLIIDGSSAGANSVGLDVGDGWGIDLDGLFIQNFTGTSAIGLNIINRVFWTEKMTARVHLQNNTNQVVLDTVIASALRSHEYCDLGFYVFCNRVVGAAPAQTGFTIQNGAYWAGGGLGIRGNFDTDTVAMSNSVMKITGSDGSGNFSKLQRMQINVCVESNSNRAFGPQTINFGSSSNHIEDSSGLLVFQFTPWAASNVAAGQISFGGVIIGDSGLQTNATKPAGWL